jgi:glutamate synthase domain-containing protein 2
MIHALRGFVLPGVTAATGTLLLLSLFLNPLFWWGVVPMASVLVVGIYDLVQTRHNILRNYPILGHFRFILEDWGPELHQYFIESNKSGAPFDRDQRSLMYQRAKNVNDMKPFGSELDMYTDSYVWLTHSIAPKPVAVDAANTLRVEVGGDNCTKKYSASLFNISAMSFGSLSANAIMAMNAGAKKGGFAHNTGEGGISQYHREFGADLIWQIGTGYFGCRTKDGKFDPELFAKQAADDQVKMIELKLSQGAKPGHGGVLPAVKVSREIAEARGIPEGEECISPAAHSAFSTPIGLLEFISTLRELSGGKPVGFKLCVGDALELLSVFKAMLESGLLPDFITVDGAEGGTGAAPLEFCDHLGTPLYDGLFFVQNALVGIGLRDKAENCRQRQENNQCGDCKCHGTRRGLVQFGSGFHVRDWLHSSPTLPHKRLSGRSYDAGQATATRTGRDRKNRPSLQLSSQHG